MQQKLIDFDKQKDVGITTLGFGGIHHNKDTHFISGLLNIERVLVMGLLSSMLSERAQKPISRYNFPGNKCVMSDKDDKRFIYAFSLNEELKTNDEHRKSGGIWTIL